MLKNDKIKKKKIREKTLTPPKSPLWSTLPLPSPEKGGGRLILCNLIEVKGRPTYQIKLTFHNYITINLIQVKLPRGETP